MADRVTKKYTVELNLDVKSAESQVKKITTDINHMWAEMGKSGDKFKVLKELADFFGQIDEKIANLKGNNLDLFNKIFGVDGANIDAALKQAMEPMLKAPELIADAMSNVQTKLATVQDNPNAKITSKTIKEIGESVNLIYKLIGQAPPINIAELLAGDGTGREKLESITKSFNTFKIEWADVLKTMSAGGGIQKSAQDIENELNGLEQQVNRLGKIQKEIPNIISNLTKFHKDGNIFPPNTVFTIEEVNAAIDEFVQKGKELKNFKGDKKSIEYFEMLSQYQLQAMKISSMNYMLTDAEANDQNKNTYKEMKTTTAAERLRKADQAAFKTLESATVKDWENRSEFISAQIDQISGRMINLEEQLERVQTAVAETFSGTIDNELAAAAEAAQAKVKELTETVKELRAEISQLQDDNMRAREDNQVLKEERDRLQDRVDDSVSSEAYSYQVGLTDSKSKEVDSMRRQSQQEADKAVANWNETLNVMYDSGGIRNIDLANYYEGVYNAMKKQLDELFEAGRIDESDMADIKQDYNNVMARIAEVRQYDNDMKELSGLQSEAESTDDANQLMEIIQKRNMIVERLADSDDASDAELERQRAITLEIANRAGMEEEVYNNWVRENGVLEQRLELLREIAQEYGVNITQRERNSLDKLNEKDNDTGLTSRQEDRRVELSDLIETADENAASFGETYEKIILKLSNGETKEILPDDAGLRNLFKFDDEGYGETLNGHEIEDVIFVRKQEQAIVEQTADALREQAQIQEEINTAATKDDEKKQPVEEAPSEPSVEPATTTPSQEHLQTEQEITEEKSEQVAIQQGDTATTQAQERLETERKITAEKEKQADIEATSSEPDVKPEETVEVKSEAAVVETPKADESIVQDTATIKENTEARQENEKAIQEQAAAKNEAEETPAAEVVEEAQDSPELAQAKAELANAQAKLDQAMEAHVNAQKELATIQETGRAAYATAKQEYENARGQAYEADKIFRQRQRDVNEADYNNTQAEQQVSSAQERVKLAQEKVDAISDQKKEMVDVDAINKEIADLETKLGNLEQEIDDGRKQLDLAKEVYFADADLAYRVRENNETNTPAQRAEHLRQQSEAATREAEAAQAKVETAHTDMRNLIDGFLKHGDELKQKGLYNVFGDGIDGENFRQVLKSIQQGTVTTVDECIAEFDRLSAVQRELPIYRELDAMAQKESIKNTKTLNKPKNHEQRVSDLGAILGMEGYEDAERAEFLKQNVGEAIITLGNGKTVRMGTLNDVDKNAFMLGGRRRNLNDVQNVEFVSATEVQARAEEMKQNIREKGATATNRYSDNQRDSLVDNSAVKKALRNDATEKQKIAERTVIDYDRAQKYIKTEYDAYIQKYIEREAGISEEELDQKEREAGKIQPQIQELKRTSKIASQENAHLAYMQQQADDELAAANKRLTEAQGKKEEAQKAYDTAVANEDAANTELQTASQKEDAKKTEVDAIREKNASDIEAAQNKASEAANNAAEARRVRDAAARQVRIEENAETKRKAQEKAEAARKAMELKQTEVQSVEETPQQLESSGVGTAAKNIDEITENAAGAIQEVSKLNDAIEEVQESQDAPSDEVEPAETPSVEATPEQSASSSAATPAEDIKEITKSAEEAKEATAELKNEIEEVQESEETPKVEETTETHQLFETDSGQLAMFPDMTESAREAREEISQLNKEIEAIEGQIGIDEIQEAQPVEEMSEQPESPSAKTSADDIDKITESAAEATHEVAKLNEEIKEVSEPESTSPSEVTPVEEISEVAEPQNVETSTEGINKITESAEEAKEKVEELNGAIEETNESEETPAPETTPVETPDVSAVTEANGQLADSIEQVNDAQTEQPETNPIEEIAQDAEVATDSVTELGDKIKEVQQAPTEETPATSDAPVIEAENDALQEQKDLTEAVTAADTPVTDDTPVIEAENAALKEQETIQETTTPPEEEPKQPKKKRTRKKKAEQPESPEEEPDSLAPSHKRLQVYLQDANKILNGLDFGLNAENKTPAQQKIVDAYDEVIAKIDILKKSHSELTDSQIAEINELMHVLENEADAYGGKKPTSTQKPKASDEEKQRAKVRKGQLGDAGKKLRGKFNTLDFKADTQNLDAEQQKLADEYNKVNNLIEQQGRNIDNVSQREVQATLNRVDALEKEIVAYKTKYNIVNGHGGTKNAYGKTAVVNAQAKYNSIAGSAQKYVDAGSTVVGPELEKYEASLKELIALQNQYRSGQELTPEQLAQFNELKNKCENYYKSLKKVVDASDELMNNGSDPMAIKDDIALDTYKDRANALKEYVAATHGASTVIGKLNGDATKLNYTIENGDGTITNMTASLNAARTAIVSTTGSTEQATTKFDKFFDGIRAKAGELITYATARFGIDEIIQQVRQGVQYVREIDTALTELKKVTNETDETYDSFLETMKDTGSVIGATVSDLTTMAAEWAKLGYTIEESAKLAESTAVLLNVSEFADATSASEALISTMQAFGYGAEESMHVVDVLNEVGNNYAITSDGIAIALQDSASALMEGGNDLEEAVALVAAAMKNWLFI